jgi:hypothetical protein
MRRERRYAINLVVATAILPPNQKLALLAILYVFQVALKTEN